MTKDILVRGFDDKDHQELSKVADEKGVSINSIIKDAVDKWLSQKSSIPKKHLLLIYDNESSVLELLKSVDRLAKEQGWFRTFCAPPNYKIKKSLSKLDWFDGTISPYTPEKNPSKYCALMLDKISKASKQKPLCGIDFVLTEIAASSIKDALKIENSYDKDPQPGIFFCPYKAETLMESSVSDMMELFLMHDPFYILKKNELYKLHVTKESPHKLFLN
ncbi:MAG: hypothetical protein ACE5R3_07745 [Nitrosopumilaceae archaeon]